MAGGVGLPLWHLPADPVLFTLCTVSQIPGQGSQVTSKTSLISGLSQGETHHTGNLPF